MEHALYFRSMSLLVTGTIGIDTVHTPMGSAERVLGGSCAYFAAAASFHAPVRVVAAVGGDWPSAHRKQLEKFHGIDLAGLEVRPRSTTFAWGGRYHNNMDRRETLFNRGDEGDALDLRQKALAGLPQLGEPRLRCLHQIPFVDGYDEGPALLHDEIGDLHLVLPRNAGGEAKLAIELLEPDGAIIADTATLLKVTPDWENNDE